jgi:hypothetical protein
MSELQTYYNVVEQKIKIVIKHCLISYTDDEIEHFVKENEHNIETTIKKIIDDFDKDGNIKLLHNITHEEIRNYLYHFICINYTDQK